MTDTLSDVFWEKRNVNINDKTGNSKSHLTIRYNVWFHHSDHKPYIIGI